MTSPNPSGSTGVMIRLLGTVGATVDSTEIDLGGPKERAVLAVLASDPTMPRSRDTIR